MKFSIRMNQKVLWEIDKKLDIKDGAILNYLIDFCSADDKNIDQMTFTEDGINYRYTWIDYSHLVKEMPLLKFKQTVSITQRLKKIEKAGFIKTKTVHSDKTGQRKTYVRLTENIKLLEFYVDPTNLDSLAYKSKLRPYKSKLVKHNTNNNNTNTINSDSKNRSLKRKEFKVNNGTYKKLTDAYQQYKGIKLEGAEYGEVKRAIKTMLYSGRLPEDIINFMKFCANICKLAKNDEYVERKFGWLQNWTILTIKRKLPEFLAGKFEIKKFESKDFFMPGIGQIKKL